jgi:hypothetical protein
MLFLYRIKQKCTILSCTNEELKKKRKYSKVWLIWRGIIQRKRETFTTLMDTRWKEICFCFFFLFGRERRINRKSFGHATFRLIFVAFPNGCFLQSCYLKNRSPKFLFVPEVKWWSPCAIPHSLANDGSTSGEIQPDGVGGIIIITMKTKK